MNDVPLVKDNKINDINTSIIAIKKQLKQINEAVGLIDLPTIDTSEFVRKSDIVDVVAIDNMHPVSSDGVARALSYSTEEIATGGKWIDGKPIYRKAYDVYGFGILNEVAIDTNLNNTNINVISVGGTFRVYSEGSTYNWLQIGYGTSGLRITQTNIVFQAGSYYTNAVLCWIEYTKN